MKTIIAGSRTIRDPKLLRQAIAECGWTVSEVFCGGAEGVDLMGADWALANSVPVRVFPAQWLEHGRAAGPIRNRKMANEAEALIALWDGQSKGTRDMIDKAAKSGLKSYILNPFNGTVIRLPQSPPPSSS